MGVKRMQIRFILHRLEFRLSNFYLYYFWRQMLVLSED